MAGSCRFCAGVKELLSCESLTRAAGWCWSQDIVRHTFEAFNDVITTQGEAIRVRLLLAGWGFVDRAKCGSPAHTRWGEIERHRG
jgi:hypothetical protein